MGTYVENSKDPPGALILLWNKQQNGWNIDLIFLKEQSLLYFYLLGISETSFHFKLAQT